MKFFFLLTAVFGVFLDTYSAVGPSCGCLPGLEGNIGLVGLPGRIGLKGDKGRRGFRGDQGETGPRGPKGNRGATGEPGRNAPIPGLPPTFGLTGEVGPPGRCLCLFPGVTTSTTTTTTTTQSSMRRDTNRRPPPIANDYYLTDEYGEPNYIGNKFHDRDVHTIFRDEMKIPPPNKFKVETELPNNGLFMMNSNGVLTPVTGASIFDLFAAAANLQSTTTTTTTSRPYYELNNNIYIMGPKGTLIPIDALGYKKSLTQNRNLSKPNSRDRIFSHAHASNQDEDYHNKNTQTSSYSQWLRSVLMGEEIVSEDDEDPNDDIDDTSDESVNTQLSQISHEVDESIE